MLVFLFFSRKRGTIYKSLGLILDGIDLWNICLTYKISRIKVLLE